MKRNNFIKALIGLPLVLSQLSFTKNKTNLEKTIFTPEMLTRNNYGLFIVNTKAGDILNSKNIGYCATVAWKLGYSLDAFHCDKKGYYGMMNVFTDGWFYPFANTYEEVCEYLNNNPHGETFRLMTKKEVIYLITNRNQGFL